jgi:hypothetical protein
MTAHGDTQAEDFNGQPAEDERGAERWVRKQYQSGDGEEESGGHHQQSCKYHGPCLSDVPEKEWSSLG